MRSPRRWKLLAALTAAMLIGSFAIAGMASGQSSDRATFTLVVTGVAFDPIERGFTFLDTIETTDGVPVDGWDGGRCINLDADDEALTQWMCELVFHLPQGDLVAAGPFDLTGDIVFAVTGGTGAFRNARGELEVVPVDDVTSLAHFRLIGASARY